MDQERYDKTKESMLHWEQMELEAMQGGDERRAKVYREYANADMRFLRVLEWAPDTAAHVQHVRFSGSGMPEQMHSSGPHQTISRGYYGIR